MLKASEDLPEPEGPVMTTSFPRGISTSMFCRLCWRAPLILIVSIGCGGELPVASLLFVFGCGF